PVQPKVAQTMEDGRAGRFCWYELGTSDMADAAEFYGAVVGWDAADAGMPVPYSLLKTAGENVGGVIEMGADMLPMGPFWLGYIAVEDVDAMTDRLVASGGSVHRAPDDIPGVGRFSVVADPQGASFALYKGMGGADGAENQPGYVGWRELHAADVDQVMPLYQSLFGWTIDQVMDTGEMGQYHIFSSGEGQQGGAISNSQAPRPYWTYYFTVDDIDAAADRVAAGGGKVLMGPYPVPDGRWILQAQDRQGGMFALLGKRVS
ncbi:MAG: putative hydroxylase, partial [Caulobacteraceae bacterium]|nr:putative hydroxylase [Caulobacteraceae bacterium]